MTKPSSPTCPHIRPLLISRCSSRKLVWPVRWGMVNGLNQAWFSHAPLLPLNLDRDLRSRLRRRSSLTAIQNCRLARLKVPSAGWTRWRKLVSLVVVAMFGRIPPLLFNSDAARDVAPPKALASLCRTGTSHFCTLRRFRFCDPGRTSAPTKGGMRRSPQRLSLRRSRSFCSPSCAHRQLLPWLPPSGRHPTFS